MSDDQAGPTDEPDAFPEAAAESKDPMERIEDVDRAPWWKRAAPSLLLATTVAVLIGVLAPGYFIASTKLVLSYVATPALKEGWFIGGVELFGLPLWYVGVLLWFVEASVALFFSLVFHIEDWLQKMPRFGKRLQAWEDKVRRRPSAQYGLGFALAVVVAIPIHSGGAIVGPMVGRSLGLAWWQAYLSIMAAITLRFSVALLIVYGVISATA